MATPRILKLDDHRMVNLANVFSIHYSVLDNDPRQASLEFHSVGNARLVVQGEPAIKAFEYLDKNHFDAVKP